MCLPKTLPCTAVASVSSRLCGVKTAKPNGVDDTMEIPVSQQTKDAKFVVTQITCWVSTSMEHSTGLHIQFYNCIYKIQRSGKRLVVLLDRCCCKYDSHKSLDGIISVMLDINEWHKATGFTKSIGDVGVHDFYSIRRLWMWMVSALVVVIVMEDSHLETPMVLHMHHHP